MLILSETQVARLLADPGGLVNALDLAFRRGDADSVSGMKVQVASVDGGFFQALPAVLKAQQLAAVKWVGVNRGTTSSPRIRASIILSDALTSEPLGLVAGTALTAIRTAAMSALAAKYLISEHAETIGFLGCGAQAKAHWLVFKAVFPRLKSALCYSLTSAEAFAKTLIDAGCDAVVTPDARSVISRSDVVISSVPQGSTDDGAPVFHAGWIKPGAYVSMVDLGRAWIPRTQTPNARTFTDYIPQSKRLVEMDKLRFVDTFEADLYGLASGEAPSMSSEPRIFVFGGMGMCDAVVADYAYRRAIAGGIGTYVDMR